jgi:hypothetical protein
MKTHTENSEKSREISYGLVIVLPDNIEGIS